MYDIAKQEFDEILHNLYQYLVPTFYIQTYLTKPIPELYKKYINKMRLSSHNLSIEQGRYYSSNSCLAISYILCLIITRCSLHKDCCACHKLFKPIRHNSLRTQHTQTNCLNQYDIFHYVHSTPNYLYHTMYTVKLALTVTCCTWLVITFPTRFTCYF
jgi:hypothetical protein